MDTPDGISVSFLNFLLPIFITAQKFWIYSKTVERGYPGVQHLISCTLRKGSITSSTDFVAPNGKEVLTCPKFSATCISKGRAYFLGGMVEHGYILAIRQFDVSRDTGTWKCRDKGDKDPKNVASVEVKSSREYDLCHL